MNSGSNSNNSEKGVEVRTHDIPVADAMTEFMKEGWAQTPLTGISSHPSIPFIKLRRDKLIQLIFKISELIALSSSTFSKSLFASLASRDFKFFMKELYFE